VYHLTHRPSSWDEVVGQEVIVSKLRKAIFPLPPYMLEGGRGLGKTSMALVLGKSLGIAKGNIIEINCVHYSTKASIEDIYRNFLRGSFHGSSKLLVLDEIHGMSSASQQFLLKELENLPSERAVIACTTTVEKVIPTLLDRFVRYRVKPLSDSNLKIILDKVIKEEGIALSRWKKVLLIKSVDGNPRNLLTSLYKIEDTSLSKEDVEKILEVASVVNDGEDVLSLAKMLLSGSPWEAISKEMTVLLKKLTPDSIRIALVSIYSSRLLSRYVTDEKDTLELTKVFLETLRSNSFLEKANLILSVRHLYLIIKGE